MVTGSDRTFVVSWSQTELDGLPDCPIDALREGAAWSWQGLSIPISVPNEIRTLYGSASTSDAGSSRRAAAEVVHRLVGGPAVMSAGGDTGATSDSGGLPDSFFVVSNGAQIFTITIIPVGPGAPPLLMFHQSIPPANSELWVVRTELGSAADTKPDETGVICFAGGTQIDTPSGARAVETLKPGDKVRTRDSGTQEILWTGHCRMTGARLHAMPHLRPVLIRPGALGIERPHSGLLVSPDHRILVRGKAARHLFGTDEVLAQASGLVDGTSVMIEPRIREVTYVHLMLPSHQIIWANGVETESFHPASAALESLGTEDRDELFDLCPEIETDPRRYGAPARRMLTRTEMAILRTEAA
ncbi:Hint domain-containing protein [Chachezhania antarctica]|uniref:Hint domain-containing protein n=1 Tax=Chachezhania antarctica TaxID=2340860 RepID=UPI000EB5C5F4|nr:Hint domain-containing protein [Chachezhania antarctica]|tara:strand:+ start:1027 stop:2100 length:1074 start_codon:yes stop_codon:yes gene_type:complete